MPRAELRKKLDETLADVFDSIQDQEVMTRGRSSDVWWYVHCPACKIDFPRPQITDTQTALACPVCNAGKIKNGRYYRDKDRIRDPADNEVEASKSRPLSVKPGSRAPSASRKNERERSPRTRPNSLPPREELASIVRSKMNDVSRSVKRVTIDNFIP